MSKEERIREMMTKPCFAGWTEQDCEQELSGWSDEDISNGYAIVDFDGTGMLQIEAIGSMDAFDGDDELATIQAIKDGIQIIPVEELPDNFERRYLGWIDTPENREAIKNYCMS